MTATSISVKAWRPFKSADPYPLKLVATFSADETDNTVTAATKHVDEHGRVETGKRARTFRAQLNLVPTEKGLSVVFHSGDPKSTGVTPDSIISIPGTVVDGFFLRDDKQAKEVLQRSALETGITEEM